MVGTTRKAGAPLELCDGFPLSSTYTRLGAPALYYQLGAVAHKPPPVVHTEIGAVEQAKLLSNMLLRTGRSQAVHGQSSSCTPLGRVFTLNTHDTLVTRPSF